MFKGFSKGITKRWLINNLSVIIAIVLLLVVSLIFAVSYVFNTSANQVISSACHELSSVFPEYKTETSNSFISTSRNYVENFAYKEKMEIMVINSNGRVMMTSTGFNPDESQAMPDFEKALTSADGLGEWTGHLDSGENVIAQTHIITNKDGTCVGAVRYVSSLESINQNILTISIIIALAGLLIITLVVISGSYFIRSIVTPVRELSNMAKNIAQGNFSVTVDKKYDDEIGELCDAVKEMSADLEAADQMKNDFISRVSHELRTPLTAIKGWAETMQLNA